MPRLVTDDKRDQKQELYRLEIQTNSFALYTPNEYVMLHFDATTEKLVVVEREGRLEHTKNVYNGYNDHLFTRLDK